MISQSALCCAAAAPARRQQGAAAAAAPRRRRATVAPVRAAAGDAYVGSLIGTGMKFGVVVGRFNDLVTKLLLEGAMGTFERHGVPAADVDVRSPALLSSPPPGSSKGTAACCVFPALHSAAPGVANRDAHASACSSRLIGQ